MKKVFAFILSCLLMFLMCTAYAAGTPSPTAQDLLPSIYLQEPDGTVTFIELDEIPALKMPTDNVFDVIKMRFNEPYEEAIMLQIRIPLANPDINYLTFTVVDKEGYAVASVNGYWGECDIWIVDMLYMPEDLTEAYLVIFSY